MGIIKKKDLKEYKPKQEIDELIDDEGSPIEGDYVSTNDSEISTAPQQTSDDLASLAIQPNRFYLGVGGGYSSGGSRNKINSLNLESTHDKIVKMVEDIITNNKKNNNGIITKPDINNDGIPDIEELANELGKPVAARHTQIFIDDINKVPLNGEEVSIVLNYLLSNINTGDISSEYKNLLKSKI